MTIKFTCDLTGVGWTKAIISSEGQEAEITASYLSDALGELVSAIVKLLNGSLEKFVVWEEEPGEYRWIFTQDKQLKIEIYWNPMNGEKEKTIFSTITTVKEFAQQVEKQFEKFLNEYGEDGYENEWGFKFPSSEYRQLKNLLNI